MRKEISRVEPWSVVKISFFLGMVVCFIAALLYGFILKGIVGFDALGHEGGNPANHVGMTWIELWLGAVAVGLAGSVFYAIAGGLVAMLYNIIARRFGGVEVHTSDRSSEFSSELELPEREL